MNGEPVTDEELKEFIERADYLGCEAWWIMDFCDEAERIGNELQEWRSGER